MGTKTTPTKDSAQIRGDRVPLITADTLAVLAQTMVEAETIKTESIVTMRPS